MDSSKQPNRNDVMLDKGQQFPLTIKRLGIDGEGVGFFKRKVVFVPGALPGEEVVCEAVNVTAKYTTAKIVNIRKASDDRVEAPCPVYDRCGGCQLQHMTYEAQLREKKDIVRQAFERYTRIDLDSLPFGDTIGMENPWRYRNKSQMQVGRKDNDVIAGLYEEGTNRLIDIKECIVQHPQTEKVTNIVKKIVNRLGIEPYNSKKHKGVLRTLVTRVGFETDEYQLVLVTTELDFPQKEDLVKAIVNRMPNITSIVQNVQPDKTPLVFGEETVVLHGKEKIHETLNDLSFELSARAFFQLNPAQTKVLYDTAKEAAELTGTEKVIDAYSGVGTIGLWVADQASEVRGMDTVEEAILDANQNAERIGANAQFVTGRAEEVIPDWKDQGYQADVVFVDPPRSGLDQSLIRTLTRSKIKRIVYVSCNPSTLAKNVKELARGGYRLKSLQPVDMFPQTSQVEAVAVLEVE
ncbi:23S rRNA (uracil(1939)-C(5))-methyltransferase RlmD [Paenalkalicoccus suaedae]|uniref:23S rRNA (Uracil(1939)-C(5))-methyltransferase RlmD n=2 Tax=Paenalkalicoccus suaedae TaxID=2592382 RepID=A0A859FK53_9BACI|nr:23S rRNA (uracil(1939)-C(5))-methyltransferase RlmD [Paenalkalicoccus suaedae]QKS73182.1 23S rRNA (uracil(1939)-C(5))-methyltransferase RlmD [Paenalkalicoccus suaedae]